MMDGSIIKQVLKPARKEISEKITEKKVSIERRMFTIKLCVKFSKAFDMSSIPVKD